MDWRAACVYSQHSCVWHVIQNTHSWGLSRYSEIKAAQIENKRVTTQRDMSLNPYVHCLDWLRGTDSVAMLGIVNWGVHVQWIKFQACFQCLPVGNQQSSAPKLSQLWELLSAWSVLSATLPLDHSAIWLPLVLLLRKLWPSIMLL